MSCEDVNPELPQPRELTEQEVLNIRRLLSAVFGSDNSVPISPTGTLADIVNDAKRDGITQALRMTGWVQSEAAKLLGIGRAQLYREIKDLGIEFPQNRRRQKKDTGPRAIIEALERSDGVKEQAAKNLGISRSWFYLKIKEHGLESPENRVNTPAQSPAVIDQTATPPIELL